MKKLLAALAVLASTAGPQAARAEFIVGLTPGNQLFTFDSATPGTVSPLVAITGLGAGEQVIGIDYRPSNQTLVALTRQSSGADVGRGRVYVLDFATGAATLVNPLLTNAAGGAEVLLSTVGADSYGIDFNPVSDALRVVSITGENLRITNGGTGPTFVDGTLNPSGQAVNDVAYTNSVPGTVADTELLAIGSAAGRLFLQDPPNSGTLVARGGPLGVGVSFINVGFDISGATGVGYLSSANNLFTVNPLTGGAATPVGVIGGIGFQVRDITVFIAPVDPPDPPAAAVPEPASLALLGVGAAGLVGYARRRKPAVTA